MSTQKFVHQIRKIQLSPTWFFAEWWPCSSVPTCEKVGSCVGTAVKAVPLNSDLDIRTTHGQAKSLRAPRLLHCASCIYRPYHPYPTSLGTINLYTFQSHCQRAARHKGAWKSVPGSFVETIDIEDK